MRQSSIKDAGQGLFARTDIEPGTIISFYNGLKVQTCRHESTVTYLMCDPVR